MHLARGPKFDSPALGRKFDSPAPSVTSARILQNMKRSKVVVNGGNSRSSFWNNHVRFVSIPHTHQSTFFQTLPITPSFHKNLVVHWHVMKTWQQQFGGIGKSHQNLVEEAFVWCICHRWVSLTGSRLRNREMYRWISMLQFLWLAYLLLPTNTESRSLGKIDEEVNRLTMNTVYSLF